MDIKTQLSYAGLGIASLEYALYIRSILARSIKPHAFSWFIMCVSLIVMTIAQILMQAEKGAWITGVSAYFSALICLISLLYGTKTITIRDKTTLALCLGGVAVWLLTSQLLSTLVLIGGAYALVMIQDTKIPPKNTPYLGTLFMWLLADLKWGGSYLACKEISWATAGFPILNIAILTTLVIGVFVMHQSVTKPKAVTEPTTGLIVRYKRKDGRHADVSDNQYPKDKA